MNYVRTFVIIITLNSSENEKCFRQNLQRNLKLAFYVQKLFSENRVIFQKIKKYGTSGQATDGYI